MGAVVVIADAELAAAQRQDERIGRRCPGIIGEVIASQLVPITAADDEDAADLAGLHCFNDSRRGVQQNRAMEADDAFAGDVLRAGRAVPGALDHGREIAIFDALHARARGGGDAGGEEASGINGGRRHDAVGGRQHRPGKGRPLAPLILPGAAIVARQVRMIAQLGVHVRWQHLAVGIYFDIGAFELLEQIPQIDHVVAGD